MAAADIVQEKIEYHDENNYFSGFHCEIYKVFSAAERVAVKLGAKTVERFFSLADDNFVEDVIDDIKRFFAEEKLDSVLVFPPVSNYRRFLIHQAVEQFGRPELATFSIGVNDERRTVVCYRDRLLSDEACARPTMGLTPVERSDADITHSDVAAAAAVGRCKPARDRPAPRENTRSGTSKLRRPDRAVYVPRALRTADTNSGNSSSEETRSPPDANKCPKSPDKSQPDTPKKIQNKNFCNVYTPPHLRSQRSHPAPGEEERTVPSACQVPNSDSAITYSDNSCNNHIEVGDNFYIGDYFVSGPLGFYNPDCYIDCSARQDREYATDASWSPNESNLSMADTTLPVADRSDIINNGYIYNKDEDAEEIELRRASQEINRSSKRIIKQTFNSDVLVISEPVREAKEQTLVAESVPEKKEPETKKPKQKLEPRASLKREENDWEAVFDDSGECLDPSLLEELTATVGKVQISKAKNNYEHYQTRGQALCGGPPDEAFAHVVEVYDFPGEFKTNDLLSVFSEYKDTGFEIKWVDDTHALIVFSSAKIAGEVLSAQRPLVRCRPLHAATLESRNKAKKCAEFLQPYRQRPETCTALARRLVSGALGVRLSTAQQERAEERRLITLAREKKRQAALHKEAAWEGSLANQSAPDA